MNYWLMKSEPDVYSIDQLKLDKTTLWDGVRNYQARNHMMKDMKKGDVVFFYHSNSKPSGIAGLAVVDQEAQPDPSQFDSKSEYFDPKATKESPRWHCVRLRFKKKFKELLSLQELKNQNKLKNMILLNNSRLSVQPVKGSEYSFIMNLAKEN